MPVLSSAEPFAHNGSEDIGVLPPPSGFHVAISGHRALAVSAGNIISIHRIHSERVEESV